MFDVGNKDQYQHQQLSPPQSTLLAARQRVYCIVLTEMFLPILVHPFSPILDAGGG